MRHGRAGASVGSGESSMGKPDGPGRWIGEASFHDDDGSVKTLATPVRLELRDE
jgi:hypothetical protein